MRWWILGLVLMLPPVEASTDAPEASCSLSWPGRSPATVVEPQREFRVEITFDGTDCSPTQGCVPGQEVRFRASTAPFAKASFAASTAVMTPDGVRWVARVTLVHSVNITVPAETVYQARLVAECAAARATLDRNMVVALQPAAVLVLNMTFADRVGQHWVFDAYNRGNTDIELQWRTNGFRSRSDANWTLPEDRVVPYSNLSSESVPFELILNAPHGNGTFVVHVAPAVEGMPEHNGDAQMLVLEVKHFRGRTTPGMPLYALALGLVVALCGVRRRSGTS